MQKTMIVDWRNPSRWTDADWARKPDLWSLGIGATKAPPTGRALVEFQHGVLTGSDALPVGAYSEDLYAVAHGAGALSPYSFTVSPDPIVQVIDLAHRGIAGEIAKVILKHFGDFAVGSHVDPWADLAWLPVFGGGKTPSGEPAATYWPKYRAGLAAIFGAVRTRRPDWRVLGQNFHLDQDGRLNGVVNGLFTEQYPTFGQTTLEDHARDKQQLEDLWEMAGWEREPLHVLELRDPNAFDPDYLADVLAWADDHEFFVSCGRDATATTP